MKQTAVEWVYNHLFPKQLDGFSDEEWNKIDLAFEQAKAIEKEQMEDMFETGHICGMDDCHKMNNGEIFTSVTFEQYYNETYGK